MSGAAAATLAETVTVGGTPGGAAGTGIRPQPGTTARVAVNPQREYVAGGIGGSGQWYSNYARSLPWAIDDITADFGDDLYERMLLDPQVAAAVTILKASVLENGLHIAPAIADPDDPEAPRATLIADAARSMFAALHVAPEDVLWDLLDALPFGNRVAEITYGVRDGRLDVIAIHPKPRRSLAFVVDAYGHVIGLLARIPGQAGALMQGVIDDPAAVPNLLPRDKFAILQHRTRDGDPRGTSVLRPAYTAWQYKQQTLREHLKYLTQFASPSLIGFTAPESQSFAQWDSLGNPTGPLDANGQPVVVTPEQAMQQALGAFRNGTAASFPHGSIVQVVHNTGDGAAFLHALELYDRYITKSILGQTLASEEGQHQARAAALVHQDILDTIIKQAKQAVVRMIRRDVLGIWVRLNWGDGLDHLIPTVTLGETEQGNLIPLITALAGAQKSGLLAPSQLTAVDALINLPPRTPEEVQAATDRLIAPSPPPVAPPTPTAPPVPVAEEATV